MRSNPVNSLHFLTVFKSKSHPVISVYPFCKLLQEKRLVSVIELGIHFKTVRGEQIVLTFQNCYEENNKIKFYQLNQNRIL